MNLNPQEILAELGGRLGPTYQHDMQENIRGKTIALVKLDMQYRLLYGESHLQVVMDELSREVDGGH